MTKKQFLKTHWEVIDDGKKKTSEIVAEMRKKFKVWIYQEEQLDANFPAPNKKTTRYFKKNIEADSELANKSAGDLEKEGIEGITLRERLILELQYFNKTGNHLDIDNWTLCSGSRDPDGGGPYVRWNPAFGRVYVDWGYSGCRYSNVRARQAVPFNPSSLSPLIPCKDKEHLEAVEQLEKIKKIIND